MTSLRRLRGAVPLALALALLAGALPAAGADPAAGAARAGDEGWRAEFDDVCAKTQDAMALSVDELRDLVKRADALMPRLARLPEPDRKVFTRRLKACRDLYAFVLEAKEKP